MWPNLPLNEWKDTYATLHMWTQIIGKIRLKLSPFINHWWESALYVTPNGLTTSSIPYGHRTFEINLNFIDHTVSIHTDEGQTRVMAMAPRTVADFYQELMSLMNSLKLNIKLNTLPQEVANPIPFEEDRIHQSYDADSVERFRQILVQSDRVLKIFRSRFIGKCSPVHFFWGSFDLAVTRFSGKRAPERLGADRITREAYSHEVISCGFWPGSKNIEESAYYAYAVPEPAGFSSSQVQPSTAFYNPPTLGFVLPYDQVRTAVDPDQTLLQFCQSTYDAAATLGGWNRSALELNYNSIKSAA